mmetsp:Transcript_38146/g.89461  ORF Transcript_38146/g.89461 Transcript_38146/m.89461 type:complete len:446 (+) Transcript_38146:180-1517(+)
MVLRGAVVRIFAVAGIAVVAFSLYIAPSRLKSPSLSLTEEPLWEAPPPAAALNSNARTTVADTSTSIATNLPLVSTSPNIIDDVTEAAEAPRGSSSSEFVSTTPTPTPVASSQTSSTGAEQPAAALRPWTVWIYVARHPGIYWPAVATLQEGFSSFGGEVHVGSGHDSCRLLEDCNQTDVSTGHRGFFVVSIGWMQIEESHYDRCGYRKTIRSLAQLGAFIILYNTEPEPKHFSQAPQLLEKWGAKEVWTYSKVQLSFWADKNFTSRFVPAGCAADLVVNVSLSASERDLSQVGFVGNWAARGGRERALYSTAFSGNIHAQDGVVHKEQWRHYLEAYPMQFNMHARWNNVHGFECLRIAQLVTNWACTLSVPSNQEDEEAFEGIVHFGNASHLMTLYHALHGNDAAIRQCQERSHQEFCTRFAPRKLFEDAGFESILQELQLAYS